MTLSPDRLFSRARAAPRVAWKLARFGRPRQFLLFGPASIGDDLLCTTVLRESARRGRPLAMMSNRRELFLGNPDPSCVMPVDDYHAIALRRFGAKLVQPYYAMASEDGAPRDVFKPGHILAEMCRMAGISGEVILRPYLHLTDEEKKTGQIHRHQIAIQSTCRNARLPLSTKEWGVERLTAVAVGLSRDFQLVQLGAASDPALPVATDLRGRTTLREAAAILSASAAFVGLEGFLTHLARAVDCPSVVVMGGRVRPETVGYACNRNLFGAVECAPCGLRDGCPFNLKCMAILPPALVVEAALSIARAQVPRPLPAESQIVAEG
jgi:hypothetical protein